MKFSTLILTICIVWALSSKSLFAQTTPSVRDQSESQTPVSNNKKKNSPRKNRRTDRKEQNAAPNDTELNLNKSIANTPPSPTQETLLKDFPGWLLGIDFAASPGFYFDRNQTRGTIGLGTQKIEATSKVLGTDVKSSTKAEYGVLGAEHRVLFASNKLFSKVAFNVLRSRDKSYLRYQSATTSVENSDIETEDFFTPSMAWGFQASPEFWIGVNLDWTQLHTRTEEAPKVVIVKSEGSKQIISAEFRNPLVHAGFEYSVSNSKKQTTSWALPMRINLWHGLFVGSTVGQTTTNHYSSPYKDEESSYAGEIGIQTGRAAISLQYNYEVTKAASDVSSEPESAVSVLTGKRKSTSLVTAFGSKTGTRLAWDMIYVQGGLDGGYYLTKAKESTLLSSLTIIWSR